MASIQDLYKRNDLSYIEELIMKVTNYAWEQMTLLEQTELREKAYGEFVKLKAIEQAIKETKGDKNGS